MNNFLADLTMNNLSNAFDNFFAPVFFEDNSRYMRTDIEETDSGYEVSIDMPGFEKEDISLALENGYLTVSAERKEKEEGKQKFLRKERAVKFSRTFYLPDVNEDEIKASYKNGVLGITLPKEDPKKKTISID